MAEKELTFWDHLDELRRVLFRVLGVWFVLAIGYFIAMPYLFDNVILAPCHNDFVFYDLLRWIGQKLDLKDEFFTQRVSCETHQYQSCRTVLCPHVYRFLDVGGYGCSLYIL